MGRPPQLPKPCRLSRQRARSRGAAPFAAARHCKCQSKHVCFTHPTPSSARRQPDPTRRRFHLPPTLHPHLLRSHSTHGHPSLPAPAVALSQGPQTRSPSPWAPSYCSLAGCQGQAVRQQPSGTKWGTGAAFCTACILNSPPALGFGAHCFHPLHLLWHPSVPKQDELTQLSPGAGQGSSTPRPCLCLRHLHKLSHTSWALWGCSRRSHSPPPTHAHPGVTVARATPMSVFPLEISRAHCSLPAFPPGLGAKLAVTLRRAWWHTTQPGMQHDQGC